MGALFLLFFGLILSRRFISQAMVTFFSTDERVIPLATDFLSLMAFWCWSNAFYNVTQGLFQGSGHTMITMIVDASRIWIFRLLTLWVCANVLNMGVAKAGIPVKGISITSEELENYFLRLTGGDNRA